MKSGIQHHPFTMSQGKYPRMIVSPVEVSRPGSAHGGIRMNLTATAQWDTGADYCAISSELASALLLRSCGTAEVNGSDVRNTYLVDVVLPNGVFFSEVPAIEDPLLEQTGVDFLIGLAVINEVDFALTHDKNGDSVLSISYPADRLIQFRD